MDAVNILLLACAFAMGFLVPRGTTCAVAAVIEVFDRKRAWRFAGFGLASLTGLVVILPMAWLQLGPFRFAPAFELSALIGFGGLLFGIGAAINGACVFGTLTKIVSGDTSYLFVLVGLWLGTLVIGLTRLQLSPKPHAMNALGSFTDGNILSWIVGLLTLMALFYLFVHNARIRHAFIMSGIGLSGGLLYALHPYWSYSAVISDFAHEALMVPIQMGDGLLPWLVSAAIIGGLVSTALAKRFKLRQPNMRTSFGSLVGGFLMAFGVVMIPGGNDGLVLSLLPSLVPAGVLAYFTMNIGISLVVGTDRLRGSFWKRKSV
jgi:uncharacterized protein